MEAILSTMNITDFGNLTTAMDLWMDNMSVPVTSSNTSITIPCVVPIRQGNNTLFVPCDLYEQLVESALKPKVKPGQRIALLLFLISFAITLVTNSVTISIIAVTESLRTKTNAFIVSLCANDILYAAFMMGLEIVILIYAFYAFPYDNAIYLKTLNFAWGLLLHISNGNLVLVSLERWLYIIHPYIYQRVITANVVKVSIALTWGSAIAVNIPYVAYRLPIEALGYYVISHAYIYPAVHCVCFLVQIAVYTHISVTTYRHLKKISLSAPQIRPSRNGHKGSGTLTSRRSVHAENWKSVKLLILICGLYFLLVSPYIFVYAYVLLNPANQKYLDPIAFVFFLLLSFHHCSNFFVYVLGIRQFREKLKSKLIKIFACRRESGLGESSRGSRTGSSIVGGNGNRNSIASGNGNRNSIASGNGTRGDTVNDSGSVSSTSDVIEQTVSANRL